jgi:hypothetical protein
VTARKKGPTSPRPWQPLYRAQVVIPDRLAAVANADPEVMAEVIRLMDAELWRNDRYVVVVERSAGGWVTHLSIRRDDRKPIRSWRDMMRIKDELAGEEVEGFELYPRRSRVVDGANQYHIWCLRPGQDVPAGFPEGMLMDTGEAARVGAVQNPLGR